MVKIKHAFLLALACSLGYFMGTPRFSGTRDARYHHHAAATSIAIQQEDEGNKLMKSTTPTPLNVSLCARDIMPRVGENGQLMGHPVWVPAFPGSGSELMRQIVHEITGLAGDEVYSRDSCLLRGIATCKTHEPFFGYKSKHPSTIETKRRQNLQSDKGSSSTFHSNAIMLLRNPRLALPSLCNWVHEMRNHAASHTAKATLGEWRAWRDSSFDQKWKQWMQMIRFWHNSYQPNVRYNISLHIPYEEMTDYDLGPPLVDAMANELKRAGFEINDHLSCRWYKVVELKASMKRPYSTAVVKDGDGPTPNASLSTSYEPDYTVQQKESMLQGLHQLVREFEQKQPRLAEILEQYRQDIEQHMPMENDAGVP